MDVRAHIDDINKALAEEKYSLSVPKNLRMITHAQGYAQGLKESLALITREEPLGTTLISDVVDDEGED